MSVGAEEKAMVIQMASGDCLFCRIAAGDVPSHRVYESPNVIGFLDIHPIRRGHVQLMPRSHFAYYDDIPEQIAAEILSVGQRLAPMLRHLFQARRVAFLFTGGDIPHAHAHVVPMVDDTDITSRQYIAEERLTFRSTPRASDAELRETALLIQDSLGGASSDDASVCGRTHV